MKNNDQLLKVISRETLESIDSMQIVTPSIYTKIFNEKAKSHSINIDEELQISQEILDIECKDLIQMREYNHKNAIQLSSSTSKAIDAIKEKDEKTLGEVLDETKKLKREIENLREEVYKDELTGAHNRKWLRDNYLNDDNDYFTSNGTIVIIDINSFKLINDEHGHAVGDKVLIFISNNLKKTKSEIVRYGGDEFIMVFNEYVTLEDVVSRVDKINEYITNKKLKAKDREFKVSFSIGISQFHKNDIFLDILEEADNKMYENKKKMKRLK